MENPRNGYLGMKFDDPFYQTDEERKAEHERIAANYDKANAIARTGNLKMLVGNACETRIDIRLVFNSKEEANEAIKKLTATIDSLDLHESMYVMNLVKGE